MLKKRTVYMAAVLSLFAALPALAAVTPITEYKETYGSSDKYSYISGIDSAAETAPGCKQGEFRTPPAGKECDFYRPMNGDVVCYNNCRCKYTNDCSKTGLKGSGGSCTNDKGSTYYEKCICADGYISANDVNLTKKEAFNLPAPVTGGGITCYKKDEIKCSTGIEYPATQPPEVADKIASYDVVELAGKRCVNGVTFSKNCEKGDIDLTLPQYKCFEAKKYTLLNKQIITCATGCSSGSNCTETTADCIKVGSDKLGVMSCKRITGCDVGLKGSGNGQYICGASSVPSGGFVYSTPSVGGTTCYKVTGCPSGYEKAYIGPYTSTDYSTGNGQTYDVKKYTVNTSVSTDVLICRKAQGCSISGQYDINTCWNGCLAWWF